MAKILTNTPRYQSGTPRPGVVSAKQIQGKPLFNNINDTDAPLNWSPIRYTDNGYHQTCQSMCVASAMISTAWTQALAADPVSAFGGIVAMNRPLMRKQPRRFRNFYRGCYRADASNWPERSWPKSRICGLLTGAIHRAPTMLK